MGTSDRFLVKMLMTEVLPLENWQEEKRKRGAPKGTKTNSNLKRMSVTEAKYKAAFDGKPCGTSYIEKKLGLTTARSQLRIYRDRGLVKEVGVIGKEKIWKWVGE